MQLEIRDKIPNGTLYRNKFNNKELFKFLKLLKKSNYIQSNKFEEITTYMFVNVLKGNK